VAEARKWLDTPYMHQGRCLGHGGDCPAPILGAAHALGLSTFEFINYGRQPNARTLEKIMDDNMDRIPIEDAKPGDVYVMSFPDLIAPAGHNMHVAMLTDKGILHAYAKAGKCVEHRLDDTWRNCIRRAYRYRGVI